MLLGSWVRASQQAEFSTWCQVANEYFTEMAQPGGDHLVLPRVAIV